MKTSNSLFPISQLLFIIIFLLLLMSSAVLSAQSHGRHQTILGRSPLNGGFGSPLLEVGVSDGITNMIGGGGGLVFRNFFFGLYGLSSTDALGELVDEGEITGIDLAHGGLWIGVTPASYNAIHPYIGVKAGWGVVELDFDNPSTDFDDTDQVFVLTPEVGLEFNLTRWMRLSGGLGYRYLNGINSGSPISESDLNGLTANITLRFGWFGSNRSWETRY
ncbi:MAG: hypothetical protein AAGF87_14035 [Bacteroidota bacterium]